MSSYELTPAYGRDYKSKKEVIEAWNAGKDFIGDHQLGFKPVNRDDLPKPANIMLRYKRNTLVTVLNVK